MVADINTRLFAMAARRRYFSLFGNFAAAAACWTDNFFRFRRQFGFLFWFEKFTPPMPPGKK